MKEFGTALTLTGMAQLAECCSAKQRVTCLIPGQGTRLGFSWSPVRVCARGNETTFLPHTSVSLSLFLPPFPSLKISKILKKKKRIWNIRQYFSLQIVCL